MFFISFSKYILFLIFSIFIVGISIEFPPKSDIFDDKILFSVLVLVTIIFLENKGLFSKKFNSSLNLTTSPITIRVGGFIFSTNDFSYTFSNVEVITF